MSSHGICPRASAEVLVVDDTHANLQLISGALRDRGYRVRPVTSGRMALRAARQRAPDIVLMDVVMPDMSGYEVCEEMKRDPALCDIPVIFLSAATDTLDKVRAFSAGGVDYIQKPFELAEMEIRMRTHLELQRQRRELQANNERLQQLETFRDSLVQMMVHDLRNPLTVIFGLIDLLDEPDRASFTEEGHRDLDQIRSLIERILRMVSSILDVSRFEAIRIHLELVDLYEICREALAHCEPLRRSRRFSLLSPSRPFMIRADGELLARTVQNLLDNALKYSPEGGLVEISIEAHAGGATVRVQDSGPGIPAPFLQLVFEKFGQVTGTAHRRRNSSGLGLTFCKMAVEAHGGEIGVVSPEGEGCTFWFSIPSITSPPA